MSHKNVGYHNCITGNADAQMFIYSIDAYISEWIRASHE